MAYIIWDVYKRQEEKVWQHIHNCADLHGSRAEYATAIYKARARAIEDIPYDRVNRGTGRRLSLIHI